MSDAAAAPVQALATYDDRPFFLRALDHGLANGLIDSEKLDAMRTDGAKGIVQIADFFGSSHLRTELEDAMKRMVYLASLYLEHTFDGHLPRAAWSLGEHTFLSHSRGGSHLLKGLFAMPTDSTILEPAGGEGEREFLRARTLGAGQWSVAEFRAQLAARQAHLTEIEAALWFADTLEVPREALSGESAESILNVCLLTRIAGRAEPGLLSAEELKAFLRKVRRAKKKPTLRKVLTADVPEAFRAPVDRALKRIASRDFPRMLDPEVAFADLVRDYHERFQALSVVSDVSDYDALVTDEWRRVTQGKTDTDSMNTVFLCLSTGLKPKPAISEAEAKKAIGVLRREGANLEAVPEFLHRSAPHQMIDGLIAQWEDEFVPEVIEDLQTGAEGEPIEPDLRLLAQHCHVKASAARR